MVPFARYQSGCSTYIVVDQFNQSTSNNPAIQDYIGCRLPWMVHHAMRRWTSIARLGEQATPTNLPAGGYEGVVRSGPRCRRPPRKWILTNNCGTQVRLYSRIPAFFFLCANGKAQILMANCKNCKAEAPQASVCWVCGCNRAQCLANFGLEDTIRGWWDVVLLTAADIAADRRIPDYGLHGVLRVTICGISGMRDAVAATTGNSAAVVVRNLFQPILDVARIQAKTVTKGRLNNEKANGKGKVRLECAAAVQFMRTLRWKALITICLEEGGMNNKRVAGGAPGRAVPRGGGGGGGASE